MNLFIKFILVFVYIYFSIWYYTISYCARDYIESSLIVFVHCSILYILLSYIYLLYPPKGICESRPQGPNGSTWQYFHFNMWLANENWGFNFELVIRRKNSAQNLYCPDGWVIFKYVNKWDALIPKLASRILYGFLIKS